MTDGFLPAPDDDTEADRHRWFAAAALLIGVLMLAFSLPALPKATRIAFEIGTPGTYVVDNVPECAASRCYSRSGTFISDDGTLTRTDVHVRNAMSRMLKQGDRIRALDLGDPHEVFTTEGHGDYPFELPIFFGPLGLVAIGLALRHFWRRRKRRQSP
ncbi:hypothetical protein LFM09_30235 [Lentzea alba]|uniref:hypothetical protein n=1 Tax=Lentzea alba TaxID=2714351 RepID=UPI0039BF5A10